MRRCALLLFAFCAFAPAHAQDDGLPAFAIGLDPGAPILWRSGAVAYDGARIQSSGSIWVRINFIVRPWDSVWDTTPRGPNNQTWFETYDHIVDDAVARGLIPYGLIGAEAVRSNHPVNSEGYVNDYAAVFNAVVDRYMDRMRVYESFNEPNDWAGGTSAQVTPHYFAMMLERIYRTVKVDQERWDDPARRSLLLVSGPLFSHENDTAAPYFQQVYDQGINQLGWQQLKQSHGTYPLDGIGYHIYVAGGTSNANTVRSRMNTNLNAVWNVIANREGADTPKRLWLSEIGWNTASVNEAGQADNVDTALNLLRDDQRVRMVSWFQVRDFGELEKWGLERSDASKKPAWDRFVAQAALDDVTPSPTPTASSTPTPVATATPTHAGFLDAR